MAKKKENKNRSYRERERMEKNEIAKQVAARNKDYQETIKIIVCAFIIVTILLAILTIFDLIEQGLLIVWAVAEIIYAGCCIIGYTKDPHPTIKRIGISMGIFAIVTLIMALICK